MWNKYKKEKDLYKKKIIVESFLKNRGISIANMETHNIKLSEILEMLEKNNDVSMDK